METALLVVAAYFAWVWERVSSISGWGWFALMALICVGSAIADASNRITHKLDLVRDEIKKLHP